MRRLKRDASLHPTDCARGDIYIYISRTEILTLCLATCILCGYNFLLCLSGIAISIRALNATHVCNEGYAIPWV